MDSHANSVSFHVTNRRQSGRNLHKNPWLFHIIYLGFICFACSKNLTRIFSCLFTGSLIDNATKSNGNPINFLANTLEFPWLELVQNPCHVCAWTTNKTWINDMEYSWNLLWNWTKLPSICDMKWHGISEKPCHIFYRVDILNNFGEN